MTPATVFVIDDDAAVRDALVTLVLSVGLNARSFASADEFLAHGRIDRPGCLICDVCLPGTDGVRLQKILLEREIDIPLIAMSAHGDIPMAVEVVRRGAIDFIEKPFRNHLMLERIREALRYDDRLQRERSTQAALAERLKALTPREQEVLPLLLSGNSNKAIARALELSPRTIETHRARILRKTGAVSVTALVHMMAQLK